MNSAFEFNLEAAPVAVSKNSVFIHPYEGCDWHAPPDAVDVFKKFYLPPPFCTLTASAIGLDLEERRPRMVDEMGKLDKEAHKVLKQLDRCLDFAAILQAYTVFFAILEQLFGEKSFKAISTLFRRHLYEMSCRYSERVGPILVEYDCRRREGWFRDFKVAMDSTPAGQSPALPPLPPFDENVFHSVSQSYKLSARDALDIHKVGDGVHMRLLLLAQQAIHHERDKKQTGLAGEIVSKLEQEMKGMHLDRITEGKWSPFSFPSSTTTESDHSPPSISDSFNTQSNGKRKWEDLYLIDK